MKELKIVLWVCAVSCLLGFAFGALPWKAILAFFRFFGIQPPITDPITTYMLRLCMATFGLIGIFFVILARNPMKYGEMLPLAGFGILFMGLFSLLGGIRYGFPVWCYIIDVIFCTVAGVLVFILRKKVMQTDSS